MSGEAAGDGVLRVRNLVKRYGDSVAVDGIGFEVREAEIFSLLGHSGCGKSTTLRMVAGLEEPDGGSIELRGATVSDPARGIHMPAESRNVGLVFQSYAIWPHMTVFENVAYPLTVRGRDRAGIRSRVLEMCEVVGMGALVDRPSTALSGGQQQRVALARAMVYEPDILLLDEPFSNLDAKLREEMRLQLQQLQARFKTTVVYVTHDQTEALALSHRIAVMRDGAVEQIGAPEEIYGNPASFFVQSFVGRVIVLRGEIDEAGDVRLPAGSEAVLPGAGKGFSDRAVRVTVRPEDIFLPGPSVAGDAVWIAGRIAARSYGGDHMDYTVAVDGAEFGLRLDKNALFTPGEAIRLGFAAEAARLWPA